MSQSVPSTTPGVALNLFGTGINGYKDEASPGADDGTLINAALINSLNESQRRVLRDYGVTGSWADYDQLANAVVNLPKPINMEVGRYDTSDHRLDLMKGGTNSIRMRWRSQGLGTDAENQSFDLEHDATESLDWGVHSRTGQSNFTGRQTWLAYTRTTSSASPDTIQIGMFSSISTRPNLNIGSATNITNQHATRSVLTLQNTSGDNHILRMVRGASPNVGDVAFARHSADPGSAGEGELWWRQSIGLKVREIANPGDTDNTVVQENRTVQSRRGTGLVREARVTSSINSNTILSANGLPTELNLSTDTVLSFNEITDVHLKPNSQLLVQASAAWQELNGSFSNPASGGSAARRGPVLQATVQRQGGSFGVNLLGSSNAHVHRAAFINAGHQALLPLAAMFNVGSEGGIYTFAIRIIFPHELIDSGSTRRINLRAVKLTVDGDYSST